MIVARELIQVLEPTLSLQGHSVIPDIDVP